MLHRQIRVALTFLVVDIAVYAQVADANLVGAVLDHSGAGIPGARVQLTSAATGVNSVTLSDRHGTYRFPNVPTGIYELTAAAEGFTEMSVRAVAVELSRTQTVNVHLPVAQSSSSVTVAESVVAIDTSTPALQATFDARTLAQIPITVSAMGVLNLSLLAAGASSSGGLGYGTGPSIGGQRPTNNNFLIEGVDNNARASTGPVLIVPNEALAEASLQQNQFSPEFGHSSGGQFNTIVKSGTSQFRGSVFHYLQNRRLNALDASYARQGVGELPRYDQNRLGGTLGGPVKANRLFFFVAVERQALGLAATGAGAVYTPTSEGMTQLNSMMGISRRNLEVFAKYVPVASARARDISVLGKSIPVGIPNTVGPSYSNDLRTVMSVDAYISDRDQMRLRWIRHQGERVENSAVLPLFYTPGKLRSHVVSLAQFHTFNPAVLNEFRLGYNRSDEDRPAGSLEFPGLDAFPSLQFDDLSLSVGPNVAYPQSNRSNVYQAADTLTWLTGTHAVKAGYDARKVNSSFHFIQRQRGEYQYRTLERFLLDLTPEWGMRSVGAMPFIGNQLSHYAFVNDEWKLRRNLTLSIGLRYEFVGVPEGARRQSLNGLASAPGILDFREPRASRREFTPRLGLAWSPGSSGRSVLRAGFGTAYDQAYHNLAMNSLPPQYSTSVEAHTERPNQPAFLANGGIPGTAVPPVNAATARAQTGYHIPDQQRPYAIQWNTGWQRVIASDYTVEVRYLGTRGVHLPMQIQLNRQAAVPTGGPGLPVYLIRPSDAELNALTLTLDSLRPVNTLAAHGFARTITSYVPRGNSSYHGLATQMSRRYRNGLQVIVSHTWSHNIDDSTAVVASTLLTPRRPQDFFDLRSERADSMLDHRHRLSAAWIYDLKGCGARWCAGVTRNWTFAGTLMAETGTWASVRSGVDSNLNGDSLADRAFINSSGDPMRSSAVTPLTNSAGKTVAYVARDPGARYIQAGAGVAPNGGRNTLRLPPVRNLDLALSRSVAVGERTRLQLRLEAYNALNHAQFVPGYTSSVDPRPRVAGSSHTLLLTGNPMFNRPDLAFESNSRKLQVVVRAEF